MLMCCGMRVTLVVFYHLPCWWSGSGCMRRILADKISLVLCYKAEMITQLITKLEFVSKIRITHKKKSATQRPH